MEKGRHNYYCVYCKRFLVGDTAEVLCASVNSHNSMSHPADFAAWRPDDIINSCNYSGPGAALPQFIIPHGTTSRSPVQFIVDDNSKPLPDITEADRLMLAAGFVKW
jgi:hypothetical protein